MEASAVPVGDRETLKEFLRSLRLLLAHLARDPDELFRPELRPLVAAAWDELEAEGRFEEAEHRIDSGEYEQDLVDHGLRGAQLEFKVATFERTLEAMEEDERKRFFTRARLLKSVPGALKAANVTLDSVAAFIPPVGAAKEFKSAAEAAIAKRAVIKDFVRGLIPSRKKRREVREAAEAA